MVKGKREVKREYKGREHWEMNIALVLGVGVAWGIYK